MFKKIATAIDISPIEKVDKLSFYDKDSNETIEFEYDPQNFVYFRCRAISADVPNSNGDLFEEEELKKSYKTFIGVGLYKDHDSDSVEKSIGKVLWAEYIPEGKYVECYCALDKNIAPDLAYRIKNKIATSVSMGCSVGLAICSYCGNKATNVSELCQHMMPGTGLKGRKDENGDIIYEINRDITFNELSIVTVPADPTARIFEVFAAAAQQGTKRIMNSYVTAVKILENDLYSKYNIDLDTKYTDEEKNKAKEIIQKFIRLCSRPDVVNAFNKIEKENTEEAIEQYRKVVDELKRSIFNELSGKVKEIFIKWVIGTPFVKYVFSDEGVKIYDFNIDNEVINDLKFIKKYGYLPGIYFDEEDFKKIKEQIVDESEKKFLDGYEKIILEIRNILLNNSDKINISDLIREKGKSISQYIARIFYSKRYGEIFLKNISDYIKDKDIAELSKYGITDLIHVGSKEFSTEYKTLNGAISYLFNEFSFKFDHPFQQIIIDVDNIKSLIKDKINLLMKKNLEKDVKIDTIEDLLSVFKIITTKYSLNWLKNTENLYRADIVVNGVDREYRLNVELKEDIKVSVPKEFKNAVLNRIEIFLRYFRDFNEIIKFFMEFSNDNNFKNMFEEFNTSAVYTSAKEIIENNDKIIFELNNIKNKFLSLDTMPPYDDFFKKYNFPMPKQEIEEKKIKEKKYKDKSVKDVNEKVLLKDTLTSDHIINIKDQYIKRIPGNGKDVDIEFKKELEDAKTLFIEKINKIIDSIAEIMLSFSPLGITSKDLHDLIFSNKMIDEEMVSGLVKDNQNISDIIKNLLNQKKELEKDYENKLNDLIKKSLDKNIDRIISAPTLKDFLGALTTKFSRFLLYQTFEEIKADSKYKEMKSNFPEQMNNIETMIEREMIKLEKIGMNILDQYKDLFKDKLLELIEKEIKNLSDTKNIKSSLIKIDNLFEKGSTLNFSYKSGNTLKSSFIECSNGIKTIKVSASDVLPLKVQKEIIEEQQGVIKPSEMIEMFKNKFVTLSDFKKWVDKRKYKNRKALQKVKLNKIGGKNMGDNKEKNLQDLKEAVKSLKEKLERKVTASKIEKVEPKIDGKAKTFPAPEPKADKEVIKTENVKVPGAIDSKAMDSGWSVNSKELVKEKAPKLKQALPSNYSAEDKEIKSEEIKTKVDNTAVKEIKQYYNELGPAGGEAPLSMDLKSSKEMAMLREALKREKMEKEALLRKQELKEIADEIIGIVAHLQEAEMLPKEKVEEFSTILSEKFASKDRLNGFKQAIACLKYNKVASEEKVEKTLPRITITESPISFTTNVDDKIEWLSKNWNK